MHLLIKSWLIPAISLFVSEPRLYGGETNQVITRHSNDARVFGNATNGLRGEVQVLRLGDNSRPEVAVYVSLLTNVRDQILREDFTSTNRHHDASQTPLFLAAPGGFCGPVELHNAARKEIPSLKSEITSLKAYPENIRWSVLYSNEMRQLKVSHVVPGDIGLFSTRFKTVTMTRQIGLFKVENYFQVKESGEYQLTVWPKIYQRTENDKDIYQRIDLPPVTATIKWGASPLK